MAGALFVNFAQDLGELRVLTFMAMAGKDGFPIF